MKIEIDEYLKKELQEEAFCFIAGLTRQLPEFDSGNKDALIDEISKILASYLSKLEWIEQQEQPGGHDIFIQDVPF